MTTFVLVHGAFRGGWAFAGRLAAWWKARIDRRWMAMYQSLRPMLPAFWRQPDR